MKKSVVLGSLLIVVTLGASLALAGCQKKPVETKSVGKLLIGFSPGASSTLPILALEQDYYAKNGVDIEFVSFSNTADGLAALQLGKVDVGVSFGTAAPLTFVTNGAKFVIIAGNQTAGHPVITKPENANKYTDINSFRGKVVGTPRLYTSDVVWRGALYNAGIDPEKDLTIVDFKRPVDVLEAVKSGKVDVGIGATSITARAYEAGLATPLFSNDIMPDHPCCRVVTTQEVLAANRPALVAFIQALLQAELKFKDDPESAVVANVHQQEMTESYARETSLEPHVKFFIDPNTKAIVSMFEYMKDTEYLDPSLTLDPHSIIDTSLYRDALKEIEKKAPSPYWADLNKRFVEWNS
jgi:NitT/TauT family transport system substrate-binding protein